MRTLGLTLTLVLLPALAGGAQNQSVLDSIETELAAVAKYEYGESRKALVTVEELVRRALGSPETVRAVEQQFVRLLGSDASVAGKDFLCRQLSLIGSEASVPVLVDLLRADDTSAMALFALERIPGAAADQALRDALSQASASRRIIGIIDTLGRRGDPQSIDGVLPFTKNSDREIADAAIGALAAIGGAAACDGVAAAWRGTRTIPAAEAYLTCGEEYSRGGDAARALAVFRQLSDPQQPVMVRVAALRAMSAADPPSARPILTKQLTADAPEIRAAAIQGLATIPGSETTAALTQALAAASPPDQVQLLSVLAARGDPAARSSLVAATKAESTEVRAAALDGLGQLGQPGDVGLLAERCARASGREQEIARSSLYRLNSDGVDEKILELLGQSEPEVKVELIRAAGERAITSASPALLQAAQDENRTVRREALRALRGTASASDVPALMNLLSVARRGADQTEAARTLASVMRRTGAPADLAHASYRDTESVPVQVALLWVMGQMAEPDSLPVLREALSSDDSDKKRQAILSLTEWPSDAPADDLYTVASSDANPTLQVLALRGYIQLVSQSSTRPAPQTVALLERAMRLATRPDEKRAILASLRRHPCKEAIALARTTLDDPLVAAEAKIAIDRIAKALEPPPSP